MMTGISFASVAQVAVIALTDEEKDCRSRRGGRTC